MIELYYWPTSNGKKITVMLEECQADYDVRLVDITKGEQFAPEFLKLSPNNRIPAIIDRSVGGMSMFESGAILQYLGRKFGRFYPCEPAARADVEQWLFWQIGGLGPMAGQATYFKNFAPQETAASSVRRFVEETKRLYGVMDRRLANREHLAGAISIADFACIGWVANHRRQGVDLSAFPNITRWFATMTARPGVGRGLAVHAGFASQAGLQSDRAQHLLFGRIQPDPTTHTSSEE